MMNTSSNETTTVSTTMTALIESISSIISDQSSAIVAALIVGFVFALLNLLLAISSSSSNKNKTMVSQVLNAIRSIPPRIYDRIILDMTEIWYQYVLQKLPANSVVLDIGIGTAGALLRCRDIVKEKNLTVIGIDYNEYYIEAAKQNIIDANMTKYVQVHCISIYDENELEKLVLIDELNDNDTSKEDGNKKNTTTTTSQKRLFDAAYFSGSFSLLPDPVQALQLVSSKMINTKNGGKIYITQTFQKRVPPLLPYIKPMLKFVTTIDFGQLIMGTRSIRIISKIWLTCGRT